MADLIMDPKRQVTALTDIVSKWGFAPRAEKPATLVKYGAKKAHKVAVAPLKEGGNWSQTVSDKVGFHKGSGQTIPFCQNHDCMCDRARHWHRDCPNGGKRANLGAEMYGAFSPEAI
ncbi:hypothetical protein CYMTET_52856 [Cymbomonas tetramitiformis]|uniref:Uncharacterized protein n=1 Tax=Cymbomonas tetramitiformis TaxID=36881 RepID=A0AAE0BI68_9CHLO|nr:hypothetical protein CYMTET_52856 [Cymbomonas tetramitiformis]